MCIDVHTHTHTSNCCGGCCGGWTEHYNGRIEKIKILKNNIAAVGTVLPEQCTWYGHQTTQHSVLFFIFLFSFFMHLRCGTLRCGSVLPERAAMQRKRATSSH
jgi:hypothetical protein